MCLEILVSVVREYRRLTSAPGGGCVRAPGGNSGKRSPGGLCRQSHFRLRYARPRPSFLSERWALRLPVPSLRVHSDLSSPCCGPAATWPSACWKEPPAAPRGWCSLWISLLERGTVSASPRLGAPARALCRWAWFVSWVLYFPNPFPDHQPVMTLPNGIFHENLNVSACFLFFKVGISVYVCTCAQSCPTLCDPMSYSPAASPVHGVLQVRMLEWVAVPSSRGSSRPWDLTRVSCVSCLGRRILYHWAIWEAAVST